MAIAGTKVNKAAKEIEVYPGGELMRAILRMLNERTPIQIAFVGATSGDIVISVKYVDLGITPQTLSHPFFRTNVFANLLGELLVRQNLDMLASRVIGTDYDSLVKSYSHRNFGLRTKDNEILLLQLHISLCYNLLNDLLSQIISNEAAKLPPTMVPAKKIKRGEEPESIQTYTDSNGLKLTVAKTSELRVCLENAMEKVLDFYGVKGKDVFINDNKFNFEFSITDEGK